MKTKKITIKDKSTAELQAELGLLEAQYNKGAIEFKNSKGEAKSCALNLIDRLGRFAGSDEDKAGKQAYLDVYFRATHEARRAAEKGADVRLSASNSPKSGVRVSSTVKGIDASKADVAASFAMAQRMANEMHKIRVELESRAAAERLKAELEAKAKAHIDTMAALGLGADGKTLAQPNLTVVAA